MSGDNLSTEKIRGILSYALALSTAILLATGWLLTWARLASERIPSENILAALPHSYFIQVALHATFAPLIMLVIVGIPWVAMCIRRRHHYVTGKIAKATYGTWAWLGFSVVLSAVFWLFRFGFNSAGARATSAYIISELLAAGICAIGAVAVRRIVTWLISPESPPTVACPPTTALGIRSPEATRLLARWSLARPFVAATVVLCVANASLLRIIDARFTRDVLPVGQIVLDTSCGPLTGGLPIGLDGQVISDPSQLDKCLVGGFYLGENGDWVYLVRREDQCPHSPSHTSHTVLGPQLISFRISDVQELVVLGKISCNQVTPHPKPGDS